MGSYVVLFVFQCKLKKLKCCYFFCVLKKLKEFSFVRFLMIMLWKCYFYVIGLCDFMVFVIFGSNMRGNYNVILLFILISYV